MTREHLFSMACALILIAMLGVLPVVAAETGRIAFVSYRDGPLGEVYVMNADGTDQTRMTAFNGDDGMQWVGDDPLTWSPDGSRVAATSAGPFPDILVIHADGSGTVHIPVWNVLTPMGPIHWSPDGSHLAWYSHYRYAGYCGVHVVRADGTGEEVCLTATGGPLSWSPDGSMIAFAQVEGAHPVGMHMEGGSWEIFVATPDGTGTPLNLSANGANDTSPAWSPDGLRLAFRSDRDSTVPDGPFDVYLMDAGGTHQVRLTVGMNATGPVTWSPDGSRLIFSGQRGDEAGTFVMNADGTGEPAFVCVASASDGDPVAWVPRTVAWSPSGRQLAYSDGDICVTTIDGIGERRLTTDPAADVWPAWWGVAGSGVPAPPAAAFSFRPPAPAPGETVTFTDGSSDADGAVVGWSWTFGDGTASRLQSPDHTFASPGLYSVTLAVADNDGLTSRTTRSVTVTPPPPVASFRADVDEGTAPLTVHFTDTSTGTIDARLWRFGDGGTSTEQNPEHTYTTAGYYTVNLTVSNAGGSDSATGTVYAIDGNPIEAGFEANVTSGPAPLAVRFTDRSTSTVPIVWWEWDFDGDGTTDSLEQNPVHVYADAGTYSVTLTASTASRFRTLTRPGYIVVDPPAPVVMVPGGVGLPGDTDGDRLCEDVNGNGRPDFNDVVLYFNRMTWISENEPEAVFDYNGNSRIDFADVVWLFTHL